MSVLIIGSINVDHIAHVAALPKPGETILAHSVTRLPGGKGANQAIAAARMGAETTMLGAVGDAASGEMMIDYLGSAGVKTHAIARLAGMETGIAYITLDAAGENQIIVDAAANAEVRPPATPIPATVMLAQLEVPISTIDALFGERRAIRILNAAPAVAEGARLFAETDILIVNQTELATYLGSDHEAETIEDALAARALLSRADQCVIVTLGSAGAVAVWRDRHHFAPALKVVPVDTIGAGDCFCGALAALLSEGRSVEVAMPIANAAAALCIQCRGAGPAMPMRAAVEALLARGAS